MSIHFISGKPGGGKTLYAVRLIVDELVKGRRPVVTNVSLKLGALSKYWQDKYPGSYDRTFCRQPLAGTVVEHISDRVRVITDEDLSFFYTFRGNGITLARPGKDDDIPKLKRIFAGVNDIGVFYVLDEVHIAFNSRAWAETGKGVLFYLSQHRKLSDDVICITQNVKNVDRQFRSVAQDYTYLKNLSKIKWGMFRPPAYFVRSTYFEPATPTSTPLGVGQFRLDLEGLAACYDTAAGVGINGLSGADSGERKTGIPWYYFVGGILIFLLIAGHFLPGFFVKYALPGNMYGNLKVSSNASQSRPPVAPLPEVHSDVLTSSNSDRESVRLAVAVTNELYSTGYAKVGKDYVVFLSDGTSVDTDSGRVKQILKNYVFVDGVKLSVRRASVVNAPASFPTTRLDVVDSDPPVIEPVPPKPAFGGIQVTPPIGGGRR